MFTEEVKNKIYALVYIYIYIYYIFKKEGSVALHHHVLSVWQRIELTSRKNME